MSDHEQWVTIQEAAKHLKISTRTLRYLVRIGRIKGYPVAGAKRKTWRLRIADIDSSLICL